MSILPPFRTADLPRLSIFVDADNISAAQATAILDLARRLGAPDLMRAYGNVCHLPEWDKVPGFQVIHSGSGKNATDMLICVDAMERALSDQCAAVLLVSSDQDFTHLATRLRGYGLTVIGAGEAKTAERFRAACSLFEVLPELPVEKTTLVFVRPPLSEIDKKIYAVIEENSADASRIPITRLNEKMEKLYGLQIGTFPEKNWRTYLGNRPSLYRLDPKGPHAKVSITPEAVTTAAQ